MKRLKSSDQYSEFIRFAFQKITCVPILYLLTDFIIHIYLLHFNQKIKKRMPQSDIPIEAEICYILKPVMLTVEEAVDLPDDPIMFESSNLKSNFAVRETRLPVVALTTAVITALL